MEEPTEHHTPPLVGAVNYLNTKPLVEGLAGRPNDVRLVYDLPSRLADRLESGELDAALVPVVELFSHPGYSVICRACIACRGPVRSVKVYFRRPPAQVRTLALDEGSRTSVVLAQLLLRHVAGVRPVVEPLPIGEGLADAPTDAVLLIGDRAIYPPAEAYCEVWDLGERWCAWTGLPFVFAVWAARPTMDVSLLQGVLEGARDRGLAHLVSIARREAKAMEIDEATCLEYLRDNLYFHLGERELAGLERFRQLAQAQGLLAGTSHRSLYDCAIG